MKGSKATVYDYDEPKAQLTSMTASGVVDYSYGYDTKNNLAYRSNKLINQKEQFTYDTQNRLTNWDIHDATTDALQKTNSIGYDDQGNITTKSDLDIPNAVTLSYGNTANPHALTSISGKPDAIPADNLDVTYTDFRKIKTLTEGAKQYSITYGVDDQRRRSDYTVNGITKTRYYLGDYEEESDNNGNVKKIHYLSGGAVLVQDNGVETLYYGYTDNQRSLIALTDQNGAVVEKYAYDPWGSRRSPTDWQLKDTRSSFITGRGYTGHEHLDPFNIINMNGRVYDPVTAQFFSPDPFIQSPGDWMNYNGYSYVMNNPTRATDPTGYMAAQQSSGNIASGGFGNVDWNYLLFFGESEGYKNDRFGFLASTYHYDYSRHGYYNGLGNEASASVAMSELYNGSTVLGSLKGSAATRALDYLKGGFTLYRFDFSSGYTSYVASLGDIGTATVYSNGGLNYSNPTAKAISNAICGDESGGGGSNGYQLGNSSPFIGGDRDWLNKTQIGMGAYGVSHNAQGKLINYAAKFDASINDLKYVKSFKVVGKTLVVAGAALTSYEIYRDWDEGKYYRAGARIVVFGAAAGAVAIPIVGWGVSAGIGLADAIWGEQFYNWVEK
jgi:RHS repeat-associated protein